MDWDVVLDDDFAEWLDELDAGVRNAILAHASLLGERGPLLGNTQIPVADERFRRHLKRLKEKE